MSKQQADPAYITISVSRVSNAFDTQTLTFDATEILKVIRSGERNIRQRVEDIRKTFRHELDTHGDYTLAKTAVASAKQQLPGVLWSGTFTGRANEKLVNHSGLLCGDLDHLGSQLKDVREKLSHSPYVWAIFISPSADGLKAVLRVPADASKHRGSFRAVEQHIKELVGVQIDESCKDVARLCFLSYDPELFHNLSAVEIEPLPEPEKPRSVNGASVDLSARQRIVNEILVQVDWESETSGFTTCPGKHLHTTGDDDRDCKIDLDQVPTVHCFHNSCRGILDGVNRELRSRIGKAECGERPPADNSRSQTKSDNDESSQEKKEKISPWAKAKSAPDFCAEEDKEIEGYAKDLVVPGAITVIAAPRGIGKTLVLHALAVAMAKGEYFRGEKVKPLRVMLVDRDNPRQVVRQRIRGWGGNSLDAKNLKVITREDAPDLKEKSAWENFPVKDYDVVLIDSLGSFTEGVAEKEGKETTEMLATLLDFIRKGPAVVALTNCTKDALNARGRGEWQDRVDIQYEVRDATAFTPSGKRDWWQELPEAGESAWADRAARRKSRIDYRLAFIPSKFRLGAQPGPFCLEVRLPKDETWTLEDVTKDLIEAGENTIKEAAAKKEERERAALNALAEVVKECHQEGKPILKDQAATYLNKEMKISQKQSRELITAYKDKLWEVRPVGGKGGGSGLFPLQQNMSTTKMDDGENPPPERTCEGGNSVGHAQSGQRECTTRKPAPRADLQTPLFSSLPRLGTPEPGLNGAQKDASFTAEDLREEERYLKEERAGIQDDDGFEDVHR